MRFEVPDYFKPYLLFLAVIALMIVVGAPLQMTLPVQIGVILSELFALLLPAIIYRRIREGDVPLPWRSLKTLGISWKLVPVVVLAAAVVGVTANLIAATLVELIPPLKSQAEMYEEMVNQLLRPDETWKVIVGAISVTIVAPFCEEFVFRGTMLPEQLKRSSIWTSVILNGVLFSAIHFNQMGFVSLAIVGTFFAHLTVYTRSLWPAILAHGALNAVNGVILPHYAEDLASTANTPELGVLGIGLAICVPLAAMLWFLVIRQMRRGHDETGNL